MREVAYRVDDLGDLHVAGGRDLPASPDEVTQAVRHAMFRLAEAVFEACARYAYTRARAVVDALRPYAKLL